jgi:hypothetical protein
MTSPVDVPGNMGRVSEFADDNRLPFPENGHVNS